MRRHWEILKWNLVGTYQQGSYALNLHWKYSLICCVSSSEISDFNNENSSFWSDIFWNNPKKIFLYIEALVWMHKASVWIHRPLISFLSFPEPLLHIHTEFDELIIHISLGYFWKESVAYTNATKCSINKIDERDILCQSIWFEYFPILWVTSKVRPVDFGTNHTCQTNLLPENPFLCVIESGCPASSISSQLQVNLVCLKIQ